MRRMRENLAAVKSIRDKWTDPGSAPPLDLPGLAWLLASSYSEVEEVLKAVAQQYDGGLPTTTSWHRELLDRSARPTDRRRAVLDDACRLLLEDYLSFRHFSRYSTFSVLDWAQMRPLVDAFPSAVDAVCVAIEAFLAAPEPTR